MYTSIFVHFAYFGCPYTLSTLPLTRRSCRWPVRTLGFSADGQFLAAGSEDLFIDVCSVATGEQLHQIPCEAATNALAYVVV